MFHHDQRVPLGAQRLQRIQQPVVVARVQSNRGFIQNIQHSAQIRPQLRRQPDALRLPAAQRLRRAVQREVIQPDLFHELQPLLNLVQNILRDQTLRPLELELAGRRQRLRHGHRRQRVNRHVAHPHGPRRRVQPPAVARRTGLRLVVLQPRGRPLHGQFLLRRRRAVVLLHQVPLPHHAEPPALRAPPVRRIVGKQSRVQFLERFPALGTAHLRAQHEHLVLRVHEPRRPLADFQRLLDDLARVFGQSRGVLQNPRLPLLLRFSPLAPFFSASLRVLHASTLNLRHRPCRFCGWSRSPSSPRRPLPPPHQSCVPGTAPAFQTRTRT